VKVSIPNDFQPRPYQVPIMRYFDKGGKRAFWVVHRRGGKDLTMLHQTCKMMHQRKGVYWHIFPTFAQARKAIWEGHRKDEKRIMENVFPGFLDPKRPGSIVKRKDEQQMMIELKNGSIWRLMGSDRIEVVGAGPVGVVYSEFALSSPRARHMISPMLRENGGWEAYITTPRGVNHAKELYDDAVKDPLWFAQTMPLEYTGAWRDWTDKNTRPYSSAEEVRAEERAAGMPDSIVAQEYDCDWNAALAGSVYGDLIDQAAKTGALEEFAHEQGDVFTTWDLGFTDSTVVWFWQVRDGGIDLIDFYEEHGKPLSHYFDMLDGRPYRYVKHWLPHDARQVTLSSGVSILNQFIARFPGQVSICPDLPLLDGIQATRWMLQQGVRFHPRVADGVKALRQYHYEYDEDKKTYANKPAHDWSSHTADALRYVASVVKNSDLIRPRPAAPAKPAVYAKPLHMSVTLNDLFAEHEERIRSRRRIA
jgi:hypothetical protein